MAKSVGHQNNVERSWEMTHIKRDILMFTNQNNVVYMPILSKAIRIKSPSKC